MKKLSLLLTSLCCMLALMIIPACSSESSSDAEALLKTVSADADAVAVLNVNHLLTSIGCKVEGTKVIWPEELKSKLKQHNDSNSRNGMLFFSDEETGISIKALCVFYGTRLFVTGLLEDPTIFKAYVEKHSGSQFQQEDGANVNGNIAYIGNQFWYAVPGLPEVSELVKFTKLSESQSMWKRKGVEAIATMKNDIAGLGEVSSLLGTAGRNRAQISMGMAALFDKAALLGFEGNVSKKTLELEGRLLTDEGKPAKFLLPTGKIDTSTIGKLGGNAEMVYAFQIPSGLMKKITGMFASFGGGLPESITGPLAEIEGTSVVAQGPEGIIGVISTEKEPTPALVEMIGNITGDVTTIDGKSVIINKGKRPGGDVEVATLAPRFKGAMFGMAGMGNIGPENSLNSLMLVPTDGTLAIKVSIDLGAEGWLSLMGN